MLVCDTSAYLNGWRDHYPPSTFPSVWALIAEAIAQARIVLPREVYRELTEGRRGLRVGEGARERSG
jgi:hypothetical protein